MSTRLTGHWLESYLKYTEKDETPFAYKRWAGIAVVASALQRKVMLDWDRVTYPNFYLLIIGPAGSGKGTAFEPAWDVLKAIDGSITFCSDATSPQGFLQQFADSGHEAPAGLPLCYNVERCNGTMSAFTVMSPEFGALMAGTGAKDQNNMIQALTALFDSPASWTMQLKVSESSLIYGACLNLIGLMTPEMIPKIFPRETIGSGFTSRFIMVHGEDIRGNEPWQMPPMNVFPKKHVNRELRAALVEDLKEIHKLQGEFRVTDGWKRMYEGWRIEYERNPPNLGQYFKSYLSMRRITHFLKLQMVLSTCVRNDLVLDESVFAQAVSILESTERPMPKIFFGYGLTRTAQLQPDVWKAIVQTPGLTKHKLYGQFSNDASPQDVDSILNGFAYKGCIAVETETVLDDAGKVKKTIPHLYGLRDPWVLPEKQGV